MSGILGMNEWEKEVAAGRNHVARLLNSQSLDEGGLGLSQEHECSHPVVCEFEHNGEMWCSACGNKVFTETHSRASVRAEIPGIETAEQGVATPCRTNQKRG